MAAVKHAMARDGFDSSVMDQDHNLPAKAPRKCVEKNQKEKPVQKKTKKKRRMLTAAEQEQLEAEQDRLLGESKQAMMNKNT